MFAIGSEVRYSPGVCMGARKAVILEKVIPSFLCQSMAAPTWRTSTSDYNQTVPLPEFGISAG